MGWHFGHFWAPGGSWGVPGGPPRGSWEILGLGPWVPIGPNGLPWAPICSGGLGGAGNKNSKKIKKNALFPKVTKNNCFGPFSGVLGAVWGSTGAPRGSLGYPWGLPGGPMGSPRGHMGALGAIGTLNSPERL